MIKPAHCFRSLLIVGCFLFATATVTMDVEDFRDVLRESQNRLHSLKDGQDYKVDAILQGSFSRLFDHLLRPLPFLLNSYRPSVDS